jgi:sec-independent protein translocase protein TatA
MTTEMLAMLNGWEIVLILAVVLVLFGAKKLPELAKGLGQGIKEFKKASREVTEEIHNAMEAEPAPPPVRSSPRQIEDTSVSAPAPEAPPQPEGTVAQTSDPAPAKTP